MFWQAHKLLLFFLSCVFATASGSIDGICLPVRQKGLPDSVSVDCEEAVSSFDSIIEYLLGGGTSFGGAVLSAIDSETYTMRLSNTPVQGLQLGQDILFKQQIKLTFKPPSCLRLIVNTR
jgi:hypothetical protein